MKTLKQFILPVILLALFSSLCMAQSPVNITLSFDKQYYTFGEDILGTIAVTNATGEEIVINANFPGTDFIQQIRIIDPSGTKIGSAGPPPPEPQGTHTPPAPIILRDGQPVFVFPWVNLDASWQVSVIDENLLDYYSLALPGWYSAQVREDIISFFPEDPGNVNNFDFRGVAKSNTVYFFIEGSTQVESAPDEWSLTWNDKKEIKIKIRPEEGRTVDDYQLSSIRLNNLEPVSTKKTTSKIEANFDAGDAIATLSNAVQTGEFYPVIISGLRTNGTFFGGAQQIEIVP